MLAGDVDECLSERRQGPTKMEQSGHVKFTKSKFSGAGNFRTAPSQQKGTNATAHQRSRYTANTHRTQGRQTSRKSQAPAPAPQLVDGFADEEPVIVTRMNQDTVRTHGGEIHIRSPLLEGWPAKTRGKFDGSDQAVNLVSLSLNTANGEMQ